MDSQMQLQQTVGTVLGCALSFQDFARVYYNTSSVKSALDLVSSLNHSPTSSHVARALLAMCAVKVEGETFTQCCARLCALAPSVKSELRSLWSAHGGGFYTETSPHDRLRASSQLNANSVRVESRCKVRKEWSVLVDGQPAVVPGLAGADARVPLCLFWGMRWQKHSQEQTQVKPTMVQGARVYNPVQQVRDAHGDDFLQWVVCGSGVSIDTISQLAGAQCVSYPVEIACNTELDCFTATHYACVFQGSLAANVCFFVTLFCPDALRVGNVDRSILFVCNMSTRVPEQCFSKRKDEILASKQQKDDYWKFLVTAGLCLQTVVGATRAGVLPQFFFELLTNVTKVPTSELRESALGTAANAFIQFAVTSRESRGLRGGDARLRWKYVRALARVQNETGRRADRTARSLVSISKVYLCTLASAGVDVYVDNAGTTWAQVQCRGKEWAACFASSSAASADCATNGQPEASLGVLAVAVAASDWLQRKQNDARGRKRLRDVAANDCERSNLKNKTCD